MISAEMPLAAAKDGLFPPQFKRLSKTGVPVFGIIASMVLASIAMIINYLGSTGTTSFTILVLMSGITAAIPYGFSGLAQIKWRRADRKAGQTSRFVRDMIVAVLALVFSILFIWYSRYTGQSPWVYWAPFLLAGDALLLGIPVYLSQRRNLTEPEPVPPYPRAAGQQAARLMSQEMPTEGRAARTSRQRVGHTCQCGRQRLSGSGRWSVAGFSRCWAGPAKSPVRPCGYRSWWPRPSRDCSAFPLPGLAPAT
jgi:Amino acid permease